MPGISDRLAALKPFSRKHKEDADDKGDAVDPNNGIAGGGRAAGHTALKDSLRVSPALRAFIAHEGILSPVDAGTDSEQPTPALQQLLLQPHIHVPPEITDRSRPLSEYFISSSHNTYLLAHQLFGTSCPSGYETALKSGARCVEIDAWDNKENKDEPKVTHGYTLVSNIPFRTVCETIRDVVDAEAQTEANDKAYRPAPIFLSLENHCAAHGQRRMVEIMKEVWGDRLLSSALRQKGHAEQEGLGEDVRLDELGSKICVIVEYPLESPASDSDSSSDEDEGDKSERAEYDAEKKAAAAGSAVIVPELAAIGVYAQSVKPANNSWFEEAQLQHGPHHHLINVSETGLGAHLPQHADKIIAHNAKHLMRVYPKGTRISSRNLRPVPFWGVGAQICALNWQTYGATMQISEALFAGSDGYVLKPAYLRGGPRTAPRRKRLRLRIVGATDVPIPEARNDDKGVKPYVSCVLEHPADLEGKPPKRKTAGYAGKRLAWMDAAAPTSDPVWDETLEWEYDDDELAFVRILLKSDDRFARNPVLATAAVRLMYAVPEWRFIRLIDLSGRETRCTLLVRMEIGDV